MADGRMLRLLGPQPQGVGLCVRCARTAGVRTRMTGGVRGLEAYGGRAHAGGRG